MQLLRIFGVFHILNPKHIIRWFFLWTAKKYLKYFSPELTGGLLWCFIQTGSLILMWWFDVFVAFRLYFHIPAWDHPINHSNNGRLSQMLFNDKLLLERDSGQRVISQRCHTIPREKRDLIVDETTELLKRVLCFVETRRPTLLVFNS